ncbi:MAG: hypothetical protein LAT64_04220 [Phycisphaerales bacterium]|nr:hypothetical protein [Planctomycetota bacterium]MCH8507958.1 hypothetical protein [Phycisphaerales bacterium]
METLTSLIVLAQVFEPSIPSVPPPPFIERWVTGSGIPGALVLAGLGIVAFIVLGRTPKHKLAVPVGAGLVLAGGVVLLIGQLVVTPREVLGDRARGLVDAAVAADHDALRGLLHEDARVRTRYASADGRDRIIPLSDIASARIESHRVREVRVDLRGPRVARTQVRLSVGGEAIPPASWWAVDWMRRDDEAPWVVTSIEPIWIQGMTDPAGP